MNTTHTTITDLIAHIEDLMGAEGLRETAVVMADLLIDADVCLVTPDGYVLPDISEAVWADYETRAWEIVDQ